VGEPHKEATYILLVTTFFLTQGEIKPKNECHVTLKKYYDMHSDSIRSFRKKKFF